MAKDDMVIPILEALWLAKKALECMPELPKDMKPSHIRVLDVIYKKYNQNGSVRVTDVSMAMQITKPSITKLINELVDIGTVKKQWLMMIKELYWWNLPPLAKNVYKSMF